MKTHLNSLFIFLFAILLFWQNAASAQKSSGQITIQFTTEVQNQWPAYIIIHKTDFGQYHHQQDTVKNSNGLNLYQSSLKEPGLFKLTAVWPDKKRSHISFWAMPAAYTLHFDQSRKLMINSDDHNIALELTRFDKQLIDFKRKADSLVGKINYSGRKIEDVEQQINHIRDSMETALDRNLLYPAIRQSKMPMLAAYALYQYAERPIAFPRRKFQPDSIAQLLGKLSASIKDLPSSIYLADKLKQSQALSAGKLLKDITLMDTLGHKVKISDFKGKFLLIDFWASWCVYCREAHPEYIRLLQKYRDKGFQIISVTLDDQASISAWKKAIREDGIGIWPQLSDFNQNAITTYDVRLIPANFLLDKQGKIISRDLRGSALPEKLKEVLGF